MNRNSKGSGPDFGRVKDIDIDAETARLCALSAVILERVRKQSGLKKKDLARRLGVSPARVTQVLNGGANITLRTVAQFALALGVRWRIKTIPVSGEATR